MPIFINGIKRLYYKTVNVPDQWENWTQPVLTSNTSYGTVSASNRSSTTFDYYKALDGKITGGEGAGTWWECGEYVSTGWWKWKLPVTLKITAIKFYARGYNNANITARFYTSAEKTVAIGNQFSSNGTPWQSQDITGIPSGGVKTNCVYLEITGGSSYVGVGEIQITAQELVKEAYSYEIAGTADDYDRYEDIPNYYAVVNGFKRIYYKTVHVPAERGPFVQPILSANGTYGGSAFAVAANAEVQDSDSPYKAYQAFDNNSSTYWRGANNSQSGWIGFYNPTPIAVQKLKWTCFYNYPTAGKVRASNDNSSWVDLCEWTNSNSSSFEIDVNSSVDYKYYRIRVKSTNLKDNVHCGELDITATYTTKEAYSYETEGTAEDYDRYEDVPNCQVFIDGVKRVYYKTQYGTSEESYSQPILTGNTSDSDMRLTNIDATNFADAYKMFDGTSAYMALNSTAGSWTNLYIEFTNTKHITAISVTDRWKSGVSRGLKGLKVYAVDADNTETEIVNWSITTNPSAISTRTFENLDATAKKFRFSFYNDTKQYVTRINNIAITATTFIPYSYEVEVAEGEPYDRYEDVPNF